MRNYGIIFIKVISIHNNKLKRYLIPTKGSTFTAQSFIGLLLKHQISISMDGRGRELDNVFIERFGRSLKQEKIYLVELYSVADAKKAIAADYMDFYNLKRKHQSLGYKMPSSVYNGIGELRI